MKRTFRTLGVFLSALFLLTACSSDDDKYNLGSFTVPFEEVVNTTKADCVVGTWQLVGKGSTKEDVYVSCFLSRSYVIQFFKDGTFKGEVDTNTIHGKYECTNSGTFHFTEYEVEGNINDDVEKETHTYMKETKRFRVTDKSINRDHCLALLFSDNDFLFYQEIVN